MDWKALAIIITRIIQVAVFIPIVLTLNAIAASVDSSQPGTMLAGSTLIAVILVWPSLIR